MNSEEQSWIQGGPLLEVSFLKELICTRREFAENLLSDLTTLESKVEVIFDQKELEQSIEQFDTGYRWDENNVDSPIVHFFSCRAVTYFERTRRCRVRIQQISQSLIEVTFGFFGSVWDLPEWDQVGVTEKEWPQFRDFLVAIFRVTDFSIGTVGIEMDADCLFSYDDCWPSERFSLDHLNAETIVSKRNEYLWILVNCGCLDVSGVERSVRIDGLHDAVLLEGSFDM